MKSDEEVKETASEQSEALDHAKRLSALQFCSHLLAMLGSNSLHNTDDDKLLKANAIK